MELSADDPAPKLIVQLAFPGREKVEHFEAAKVALGKVSVESSCDQEGCLSPLHGSVRADWRKQVSDEFPAQIAFLRAWGIYLTRNCAVSENDARRCMLERFLKKRCQAGESDPAELTFAGLSYLRRLDLLSDN